MFKSIPQTSLELKADQPGAFRAIIATFNVVDHDGDVTLPGAFHAGMPARVSAWGHSSWGRMGSTPALPVGKGVIGADQTKAWIDGEFFLDTTGGKDTYEVVKGLGPLQEWSYGFDVAKSSFGKFADQDVRFLEDLMVHEASPVMLGAGIGTGTEMIKSNLSFEMHHDIAVASLADLVAFVSRAKSLAGLREKSGRVLSAANLDKLTALQETMRTSIDELSSLLEAAGVSSSVDDGEEAAKGRRRLLGEFLKLTSGI